MSNWCPTSRHVKSSLRCPWLAASTFALNAGSSFRSVLVHRNSSCGCWAGQLSKMTEEMTNSATIRRLLSVPASRRMPR